MFASNFKKAQDRQLINFPLGFTWADAPINIYRNSKGVITTDFDVSNYQYIGAGKTYYADITKSDSNDGLTPTTAFKSVWKAATQADVDIVIVADGFYPRENGFNGSSGVITRDISIKAATGASPIITTHSVLSWAKTDGYTNVYHATRASVSRVFDASIETDYGDYTELTLTDSIANVDATAGTYFIDSGVLYVHTPDSRVADSDILAFLLVNNLQHTGDKIIYAEGLKLYGGQYGAARVMNDATHLTPKFYAKNCEFKYSSKSASGNALTILGGEISICQNCLCAKGGWDGFNYHAQNGTIPKFIEIDCTGRDNDLATSESNNASTAHDGIVGIRVNGEYCRSYGGNVIDSGTGTMAWNIGCVSHNSLITSNFFCDTGVNWYMDSCIGFESQAGTPVDLTVESGATVYRRNCVTVNTSLIGTVIDY